MKKKSNLTYLCRALQMEQHKCYILSKITVNNLCPAAQTGASISIVHLQNHCNSPMILAEKTYFNKIMKHFPSKLVTDHCKKGCSI